MSTVRPMGELVDIAGSILLRSERSAEIAAQNIANLTTPGFKSYLDFSNLVKSDGAQGGETGDASAARDFADGSRLVTNQPLDLAIQGRGFFVLQSADGLVYTRGGSFHRDSDGRLAAPGGLPVLGADGSVIKLSSDDVLVQSDGLVLENGEPAGRIALVDFEDLTLLQPVNDGAFSAGDDPGGDAAGARIQQGVLEASNVSSADQMIAVMEAVRRAESGQRIIGVYDDLMGRVISTLGQG